MGGDELVASVEIGGGDDRLDLFQRHLEGTEAPDDLGGRDLLGGVAPMTGVGVDVGRLQQADAVVVAERLHAEVGGAGEVTDGQGRAHSPSMRPPPRGDTSAKKALDPPARAAVNLYAAGRVGRAKERSREHDQPN